MEEQTLNIKDYGFDYNSNFDNIGTPARITAVHKGRFGIVSDFGEGFAQLKGKEYYLLRERAIPDGGRLCADRPQQGRRQPHYQDAAAQNLFLAPRPRQRQRRTGSRREL